MISEGCLSTHRLQLLFLEAELPLQNLLFDQAGGVPPHWPVGGWENRLAATLKVVLYTDVDFTMTPYLNVGKVQE